MLFLLIFHSCPFHLYPQSIHFLPRSPQFCLLFLIFVQVLFFFYTYVAILSIYIFKVSLWFSSVSSSPLHHRSSLFVLEKHPPFIFVHKYVTTSSSSMKINPLHVFTNYNNLMSFSLSNKSWSSSLFFSPLSCLSSVILLPSSLHNIHVWLPIFFHPCFHDFSKCPRFQPCYFRLYSVVLLVFFQALFILTIL